MWQHLQHQKIFDDDNVELASLNGILPVSSFFQNKGKKVLNEIYNYERFGAPVKTGRK